MKLWEHFSNDDFFRVLESEAYIKRFRGCSHPIYRQNGGIEFHNPDVLRQALEETQQALKTCGPGKRNQWILSNRVNVIKSWLQQSEWILDRLLRYPI